MNLSGFFIFQPKHMSYEDWLALVQHAGTGNTGMKRHWNYSGRKTELKPHTLCVCVCVCEGCFFKCDILLPLPPVFFSRQLLSSWQCCNCTHADLTELVLYVNISEVTQGQVNSTATQQTCVWLNSFLIGGCSGRSTAVSWLQTVFKKWM